MLRSDLRTCVFSPDVEVHVRTFFDEKGDCSHHQSEGFWRDNLIPPDNVLLWTRAQLSPFVFGKTRSAFAFVSFHQRMWKISWSKWQPLEWTEAGSSCCLLMETLWRNTRTSLTGSTCCGSASKASRFHSHQQRYCLCAKTVLGMAVTLRNVWRWLSGK